ncbi:competence protein ComEC [Selenomonas sp. GACV-9]|uniref:DNA internalization-related competence protein ComEC/Rec2 n=1 Tax=Selenomonas sp. GACV-9 TaxID=3158782 RepID=UPI0008EE9866|nr:competence protein ComEC [Selenomonas ruminantium]
MERGQHPQSFLAGCLGMLCIGILLGKSCGWSSLGWLMAIMLLTAAFGGILALRGSRWSWLVFLLVFAELGMVRFIAANELPVNDISHFVRQEVKVTGTLREEPRVTEDLTGQKKVRYVVDVSKVKAAGKEQPGAGGLYIYSRPSGEIPPVRVGDRITAAGRVRLPHGYQNPGQLDTAGLLKAQGITATLATGKQGVQIEAQDGYAFARWVAAVRAHYHDRMAAVMPREDAAAIFAMLFGGYEGIRPELLLDFTTTGIVHILSVSGSHISLLAAVMAWLGTLLRLPGRVTALLVIGVIAVYSILSGCVPPVIRSAIMGGLTFMALAMEREKTAGHILLVTGLMMLIISPLLLFHISFELSFLATAGLLFLAPGIRQWLRGKGLPDFLAGSLAITVAAQAATLPILAWYFNQLSLSSLLANLFVVPIIEWMIVAALAAGLLALCLPLLGKIVFAGDSLLLGLVTELTRVIARLPASQIWIPSFNSMWCLCYYSGLGVLLLPEKQRGGLREWLLGQKRLLVVSGLVIACLLGGWRLSQRAELAVHFIDVGQGDACLVVTPAGHAFLFDTGGTRDGAFDVGARVVVPYLHHYGVRRLDAVFLTHAHEDHAGGCGSVLQKMPVGMVYTADEGVYAYARSMRLGDNDPLLHKFLSAKQGQSLSVDGMTIEVLYAPPVAKGQTAGNEASNVYRITYGRGSFLITGDLTKEKEADMLASGISPASTVLKAAHHGSNTSNSEPFLQAVHPRWAVCCVGADNSFGHPKAEVLERFAAAGVTTLRTDEDGAVVFHTDGQQMHVTSYREGK